MLDFIYENRTRLVFGKEALSHIGDEARRLGSRILVLYGGGSCIRSGLLQRVRQSLQVAGVEAYELGGVEPNPKMGLAYQAIALCRDQGIQGILAVGGGSVIDTAKTVAMGACYEGDVWDFFSGRQAQRALDVGVILTIPAAGSESSMDAVMTLEEGHLKRASCAAPFLRPLFALLDPQLTYTLPAYQTACGACDMMAHVMERYFTNTRAVDVTDRLCEALMVSVMRAAPRAIASPEDYDARAELMLAGTYAHNNSVGVGREQDWASHGLGHEISALTGAAHGATLSVIFPAWMRVVYHHNVQRFAQWAYRVLDVPQWPGEEARMAEEGIDRLEKFWQGIGLPVRLQELGITEADIEVMADKCGGAGSFVRLDREGITEVYRMAMRPAQAG